MQNQSSYIECSSWSFKKTQEKGLPGSNSAWHSNRFGHWPSYSFRWQFDVKRWGTRRWLYVLYWSFLWRPCWRRLGTMCEMFRMGAHILCWYEGRFCLWALSVINSVLFLGCILCICNFFLYVVTILCAFFVNYSPPQIRRTYLPILGTRVCLIWGDEAFTETNFIPVFLFIMYDVYVATISSLIK
jgi:hypothetical protein